MISSSGGGFKTGRPVTDYPMNRHRKLHKNSVMPAR
jgi:hypothetical protein